MPLPEWRRTSRRPWRREFGRPRNEFLRRLGAFFELHHLRGEIPEPATVVCGVTMVWPVFGEGRRLGRLGIRW